MVSSIPVRSSLKIRSLASNKYLVGMHMIDPKVYLSPVPLQGLYYNEAFKTMMSPRKGSAGNAPRTRMDPDILAKYFPNAAKVSVSYPYVNGRFSDTAFDARSLRPLLDLSK